jgi:hypothetical protein
MRGKRVVSRIGNVCNLPRAICRMQSRRTADLSIFSHLARLPRPFWESHRAERLPRSIFDRIKAPASARYGLGTITDTDMAGIV